MAIRVIINGANGKMGTATVAAVEQDPELDLVAKLDLKDDLAKQIQDKNADVVVDFTAASSAQENLQIIIDAGARPVIGTTGLLLDQVQHFQKLSANKKLGGIIAPNFSVSAVLMMKYAADAAQYLSEVEIIEMHHDKKEDSPSGTAIKTSQMIIQNRKHNKTLKVGKETIPGARGADNDGIAIHAVRLPGFVASQEVIFGGSGETLKIRHDSINRECFMPGVLLSCKKVMQVDELVYGLENFL